MTQKGSQVIIIVKVGLCVADRQIQKSLSDINAILIVSPFIFTPYLLFVSFLLLLLAPFTILSKTYGFPHLFVLWYNRFFPFPVLIILTYYKNEMSQVYKVLTSRVISSLNTLSPSFLCNLWLTRLFSLLHCLCNYMWRMRPQSYCNFYLLLKQLFSITTYSLDIIFIQFTAISLNTTALSASVCFVAASTGLTTCFPSHFFTTHKLLYTASSSDSFHRLT